jgi:hypothetical protein
MTNIQPVTLWVGGQQQTANVFQLSIDKDNLKDWARLYYQLGNEQPTEEAPATTWLLDGNLTILGEDYVAWDADPSANEWIYNWSAGQLNITLI